MKKYILLIAFTCICIMTNAQWLLTGNAGTNPLTDFIGTTDNVPLNFRVFNTNAGVIDITNLNTALGYQSGISLGSGNHNSFFGAKSGLSNSTGTDNTYIGFQTGNNATTGVSNTCIGSSAGSGFTTGSANTAIGGLSGMGILNGSFNTFLGYTAQATVSNLQNATAIGYQATVSSSNSMVLGNNVNVGIGISAPLDKLHVVGNIRMVDGNQFAGKVLTSDANGTASWQAIPPTIPTGAANGDLNGTYPNPTVDGLQGVAVSSTAPATGQVLTYNGTQWNAAAPAGVSPIGTANGDLNGTYPNPTVDGLQGVAVSSTAPTTGQVLTYNGTQWNAAAPASVSPSGTANGDLNGTYPNPTVDGLQGVAVSSTAPATGQVLTFNGTQWNAAAPASVSPSGTANGDLSGTYPNPTVDGLQGVAISSTTPATGQVLTFNGTQWNPAIPASVSPNGAASGDLGGTYPNPVVDGLQGVNVANIAPTANQVLQYNGLSWTPASLPVESSDWKITGNAGTNTVNNFIGTTDNTGLSFRTNNTQRVMVAPTGEVGIGTNPNIGNGVRLNVSGTIAVQSTDAYKIGTTDMLKLKQLAICIGDSAGANNQSQTNLFMGPYAGYSNTTGAGNSFIGIFAGQANVSGIGNTYIGNQAGKNATGGSNVIIGDQPALNLTTGSSNVILGRATAQTLTTSSQNTIIGSGISTPATLSNSIVIGTGASISSDNSAVIGNSSVARLGIGKTPSAANIVEFQVTTAKLTTGGVWTNASDRKLKDNIQQLDKKEILEKINNLEVARWHYKADKEMKTYIGPFAKEFYAAFKTGDDSTVSTIDPAGVALIGVQQLSIQNEEKDTQIKNLQNQIDELKALILSGTYNNGSLQLRMESKADETILGQNVPNPFDNSTIIPFRIPTNCSSASIMIVETASGKVSNVIPISCNETHVMIDAGKISSGNYSYTLFVNGNKMDTKYFSVVK